MPSLVPTAARIRPFARAGVRELAAVQDDVLSRAQLRALGVTVKAETAQLRAGRWSAVPPHAVVLHNGQLTAAQRVWVALLNAGPGAAVCARTALALDGLTGWERDSVEILVTKGSEVRAAAGVRVHESRRYVPERDIHPVRLPPRTRPARSAVDAAAWSRSPRTAVGLLAAVVQQRLARPDDLLAELELAGRVRHARLLGVAIADIAGGSQALSEIDLVQLCRAHRLPVPDRQVIRREPSGRRRYLDAEWTRPGRRPVVVEVDGALHLLPRTYWDDMQRSNELVVAGRAVLRFPAFAVRAHPELVAAQLRRALDLSG
jgi:hypothetical protein